MVKTIPVGEALKKENSIIVDTRTPNEYNLDHLPNSINIPIFSNDERVMVGTIYKQVSRDLAIERGVEFFSKNLPNIMKEINKIKNKILIIQCWRGGMRSKALASLLESLDYDVYQLEGGYKAYRAYVREQLSNYKIKSKIVVLHGLTGTCKTRLLLEFKNNLDLEGLARHRGSMYGGIGLVPNHQKKFENLLLQRLNKLKDESYIIIEGESKRIGNVIIPPFLWCAMNKGIKIEIKRDLNLRAKAIVEEYFDNQEKINKVIETTKMLKKNISNKEKDQVIKFIQNNNYNEAVKIILLKYYDPLYKHTLNQENYDFSINNNNILEAKKELKEKIKSRLLQV